VKKASSISNCKDQDCGKKKGFGIVTHPRVQSGFKEGVEKEEKSPYGTGTNFKGGVLRKKKKKKKTYRNCALMLGKTVA